MTALAGVDLELRGGEIHGLLGENGAGKSTLIKVLAGYHRPDAGRLELYGRPVIFRSPRAAREAGIATIYQELTLAPHLTVAENICLGREPAVGPWLNRRRMEAVARAALDRLGVAMDPWTLVRDLTVGAQQMVEIARALNVDSRVLILDEPTAALTLAEAERLFAVLEGLRRQGVAIAYISHRLDELFRLCDRVTVMRDGQVVATCRMSEVDAESLIRMMVGRPLQDHYPARQVTLGHAALEVRNLSRRGVLHDVSVTVRQGEVVGLAGLMGAGRTELLRAVAGLDPVDGGTVRVAGQALPPSSPQAALAAGLVLVPEDRKRHGLFLERPVRENLTLAALGWLARWGWISHRRERDLAQQLVAGLGIRTAGVEQPVAALSGGNQQKVILARWLALKPRVLLLDEPTRGIDVGAKAEIYRLINRLAAEGMAVLMASSDLPELLGMCDRILVMRQGRIAAEFAGASATQEGIMRAATG